MQLKVEMQEVLLAKEEQEELLRRRERELAALKGALKEEVSAHDQEVDKMKEQYEKEISRLQTSLEDAKQVIILLFESQTLLLQPLFLFDLLRLLLMLQFSSPLWESRMPEKCGDKLIIRRVACVCHHSLCYTLK